MILFENGLGVLQIQLVVRSLVPGQLRYPLEVSANHLRFHRFATGALQSSQLALYFLPRFLWQLKLRQLIAKFRDLLARIVVAELLLNRLELLAEIHLALTLTQLLLDLRLDVFLCFQQTDLPLYVHQNPAQSLFDAQCLEQSLLFRNRELDVTGNEICKPARIGDGIENLVNDFLGKSATLTELSCPLARFFL